MGRKKAPKSAPLFETAKKAELVRLDGHIAREYEALDKCRTDLAVLRARFRQKKEERARRIETLDSARVQLAILQGETLLAQQLLVATYRSESVEFHWTNERRPRGETLIVALALHKQDLLDASSPAPNSYWFSLTPKGLERVKAILKDTPKKKWPRRLPGFLRIVDGNARTRRTNP